MTGDGRCAQARRELGVYVLGAIEPATRGRVDGHLAACPQCRAELAGLAGLPALLRKVPTADAAKLLAGEAGYLPAAPPLGMLLGRVARIRRRRRWLAAGVAAVMLAAVALVALHPARPAHPGRSAGAVTVSAADPRTGT